MEAGNVNRIRAVFNEESIRVYQAYNDKIADEALRLGTFGSSFNTKRMTWIKPSFLWMMYRSGWGTKENQERILGIDIKRSAFDYLCKNAVGRLENAGEGIGNKSAMGPRARYFRKSSKRQVDTIGNTGKVRRKIHR